MTHRLSATERLRAILYDHEAKQKENLDDLDEAVALANNKSASYENRVDSNRQELAYPKATATEPLLKEKSYFLPRSSPRNGTTAPKNENVYLQQPYRPSRFEDDDLSTCSKNTDALLAVSFPEANPEHVVLPSIHPTFFFANAAGLQISHSDTNSSTKRSISSVADVMRKSGSPPPRLPSSQLSSSNFLSSGLSSLAASHRPEFTSTPRIWEKDMDGYLNQMETFNKKKHSVQRHQQPRSQKLQITTSQGLRDCNSAKSNEQEAATMKMRSTSDRKIITPTYQLNSKKLRKQKPPSSVMNSKKTIFGGKDVTSTSIVSQFTSTPQANRPDTPQQKTTSNTKRLTTSMLDTQCSDHNHQESLLQRRKQDNLHFLSLTESSTKSTLPNRVNESMLYPISDDNKSGSGHKHRAKASFPVSHESSESKLSSSSASSKSLSDGITTQWTTSWFLHLVQDKTMSPASKARALAHALENGINLSSREISSASSFNVPVHRPYSELSGLTHHSMQHMEDINGPETSIRYGDSNGGVCIPQVLVSNGDHVSNDETSTNDIPNEKNNSIYNGTKGYPKRHLHIQQDVKSVHGHNYQTGSYLAQHHEPKESRFTSPSKEDLGETEEQQSFRIFSERDTFGTLISHPVDHCISTNSVQGGNYKQEINTRLPDNVEESESTDYDDDSDYDDNTVSRIRSLIFRLRDP